MAEEKCLDAAAEEAEDALTSVDEQLDDEQLASVAGGGRIRTILSERADAPSKPAITAAPM